ncbi:MAG: diacylglycerol kinase [Alphaproteobacteria bacterium]|nr:diacylglycerol kinase [Alphaproteobacteria bacterium]
MKATDTGIKRILKAFTYSYDGFKATFKSEAAFRQDIVFVIIMTIIALCFNMPAWQQARLIASLLIVLLAELINTAIETIIDRISEEYHELSKKAKDIGSLLVLISFIYVTLIWTTTIYGWIIYTE